MMPSPAVTRIRRAAAGISWRHALSVLCALAIVIAMVAVAEAAQTDAERHLRVQVMVERVNSDSQEVATIMWQGVSEMSVRGGGRARVLDPSLVNRGFAVWQNLSGTLNALRASDHGPTTLRLVSDADALFSKGSEALALAGHTSLRSFLRALQRTLRPASDRLDRDARAANAAQQSIADHAEAEEELALLGSLFIGLLLLALLGVGLHRAQRRVALADTTRAMERRTEQRVRALVEHSSDVITVVGRDLVVRWVSAAARRTLGRAPEELMSHRLSDLVHPEDALELESHFASALAKPGPVTFTVRVRHGEGEWRHLEAIAESRLEDPAVDGVVLSMRDITERQALEAELRHQAFHDALTGLANRALFEDRLAHALAAARRHDRRLAILFLDLDDFKTINDSLGHLSGDELLRTVAQRLAGVVRVSDTAARLGGDEFAILLETLESENHAEAVAERLLDVLREPFHVAGRELRISASVGLAKSDGRVGVDELVRNADTAMYAAKESGKGTTQAFEPGMYERVLHRLELTGELQRALESEQFELDYQPIVELDSGRIIGTEALVRWAHPARGRLAPFHFIGLAEETGLIVPLGDWILRRACAQGAIWQQQFPEHPLDMNVNVSTRQLHDPEFPALVAAALRSSGLPASQLVLEITESLLPDDSDEIMAQLTRLKDIGVRVAVDDFGTGYSALSRLQAYPVDILKIDRSFIDGIERDPGKGQLVKGIVNLGESLNLQVVAEGIEEREQADQLRQMRSPLGQGFLFSRPVDEERMEAMLRDGSPLLARSSAA